MQATLSVSQARLDRLMAKAWPALEQASVDGWLVRFAGGVTRRANSVLPLQAPENINAALAEVERRSAARWQEAIFQISPAAQPEDLDDFLAARGYRMVAPTLVQVLEGAELGRFEALAAAPGPGVELAGAPGDDWLAVFWSIDGPYDPSDQAVSRQILTGPEAVYAAVRDDDGAVVAVGRMALVDGDGGISCLVTRTDGRRHGYARRVAEALLGEAAARGLGTVWLQVEESNTGAIVLYNSLGFDTVSKYHYRSRRV